MLEKTIHVYGCQHPWLLDSTTMPIFQFKPKTQPIKGWVDLRYIRTGYYKKLIIVICIIATTTDSFRFSENNRALF